MTGRLLLCVALALPLATPSFAAGEEEPAAETGLSRFVIEASPPAKRPPFDPELLDRIRKVLMTLDGAPQSDEAGAAKDMQDTDH